jgi:putative two-component system response regulator
MTIDSEILSAKILIIDDQKVSARLLEEIFRKAGYKNITCVHDSRDAQTVYAALKPHAVVLDIDMPYLDGFQVISQLKKIEGDDYLPVLMLAQIGDNDLRFLAMESGAKDYLNKPFDHIEVLLRVRNLIETHLLHDRLREENKKLKEELQRISKEKQEISQAPTDKF